MSNIRPLSMREYADLGFTERNEFRALPNHDEPNPASLLLDVMKREPAQPDWPFQHPGLEKHPAVDRGDPVYERMASYMKSTDHEHQQLYLDTARAAQLELRAFHHRLEELFARNRHVLYWTLADSIRRERFFAKVRELMEGRSQGHALAVREQREKFDVIRDRASAHALAWAVEVRRLTVRTAEERRGDRVERARNLFESTDAGAVGRLPGSGEPLQIVLGDLALEERARVIALNNKWRASNTYMLLPNGALKRSDIGLGDSVEEVTGEDDARDKKEITREHKTWWDAQRYWRTPNGGYARLAVVGLVPGQVAAEAEKPKKDERTKMKWRWRQAGLYVATSNDSIGQLKVVGESAEKISSDFSDELKDEITAKHAERRFSQVFDETSNEGFARAPDHGRSLEDVGGDFRDRVAKEQEAFLAEARAEQLFAPTENDGIRQLPKLGSSMTEALHRAVIRAELPESAPVAPAPPVLRPDKPDAAALLPERTHPHTDNPERARAIRAFERTLAAHQQTVSALVTHTAKLPESAADPRLAKKAEE